MLNYCQTRSYGRSEQAKGPIRVQQNTNGRFLDVNALAAMFKGGRSAKIRGRFWSLLNEHSRTERDEQNYADKGICCKERGIHTAKIGRFYKRVLVNKEQTDRDHAGGRDPAEAGHKVKQHKDDERLQMKKPRDPQRVFDTISRRDRAKSGAAVKFKVLAGVHYVETGGPHQHQYREQDRRFIGERSADGYPGGGRRDSEGKAEYQMGKRRKSFCV